MAMNQVQLRQLVAEIMNKEVKDISTKKMAILEGLFNKLQKLLNMESEPKDVSKFSYYRSEYQLGITEYYDFKRMGKTSPYKLALPIITQILDLLRGEEIELKVYKILEDSDGNTSIEIYTKAEKDVDLIRSSSKVKNKETNTSYDINILKYSIESLGEAEKANEAFVEHYLNFKKIAYGLDSKKGFNEGHLVEAYQRHLDYRKDVHSDGKFSDTISEQETAISLYYSMNNIGWWKGGDVGNYQVKKINNQRLATYKSIKYVANKLIQMYNNPLNFTADDFQKIFGQEEKDIFDTSKLEEKEVNKIKNMFNKNLIFNLTT